MSLDQIPPAVFGLLELLADRTSVPHDDLRPELRDPLRIALRYGLVATQTAGLWGQALEHDAYRGLLGRAYWLSELGRDVLAWHRERPKEVPSAPPLPDPEAGKPTLWYHGMLSYSLDRLTPSDVSIEQHNLLQAFLDKSVSLKGKDIKGVTNVSKVVGKLVEKFGRHPQGPICPPKKKGDGYFIRVRSLPENPC